MEYRVYKLSFQGGVHFGRNRLEDGESVFYADTLFSALCQEALKKGQAVLDELYQYAQSGELLFSDAFPYVGDTYYLPKPMKRIESGDTKGDSVIKKAYKKLKYIPAEQMEVYLQGHYDVLAEQKIGKLGHFEMKVSAAVRGEEETKPYRVGCYYYNKGNGVYIIVGYEKQDAVQLAEELLESLKFSGIGGERAAGMGRFKLEIGKLPEMVKARLEKTENIGKTEKIEKAEKIYMTLSVSLPTDEEIEKALKDAEYLLCKRSGFVASDTYAKEQRRKRDLYVLKAGSCVKTPYQGFVYDVSDGGLHSVYRYAKPMFMEVGI